MTPEEYLRYCDTDRIIDRAFWLGLYTGSVLVTIIVLVFELLWWVF